jgi:Ran GTPase-activating protein (RanGAP) involved in mRNA processing and transport
MQGASKAAKGPKTSKKSLREVYEESCAAWRVRPNSVLSKTLPEKPGIALAEVLDLSRNYVGDRGLLPVLDIVQKSPQLRRLVFAENGLRNNAIKAMVQAVLKHPSITSIDVSENYISEGAGKALETLLRENPRIVELGFSNTKIDVDCRLRLKDLVALNAARSADV